MDYKQIYYETFNAITDIIEQLKALQAQMEEAVISDETNSGGGMKTADSSESC
ncbi:MAG: hypothetical protein FWG83_03535 [Oscillospiraceae bacterium]|nr:hypothetical protein [Oscillospiraceae bacterium]